MERGRSNEAFLNVLDGGHERTRFLISASLHRCFFFFPPFVSHPIMNYPGEFVVMLCGVGCICFFIFDALLIIYGAPNVVPFPLGSFLGTMVRLYHSWTK